MASRFRDLIERLGANVGNVILGIAWALWHLPLFVVLGTPQYGTPFMPFLVELTAWSMVITFVMHARGSSSCGDAFPRIRELVRVHDVGTRCDGIRIGAMGRNSCYRELADADSS